ncbi:hypothetical protein EXIGLDRAFT_370869 [Exidia glandulosa HHB12029]|uniref:Secreted protein n=1 Tax=Exidia glandulosa HHB12029 TaxID=1314781 RepID=A0A165C1F2_EXIGL|nr:hypothetical protein EXIGLDRAFT_370869 [Exidia glandulosa HHB12029]
MAFESVRTPLVYVVSAVLSFVFPLVVESCPRPDRGCVLTPGTTRTSRTRRACIVVRTGALLRGGKSDDATCSQTLQGVTVQGGCWEKCSSSIHAHAHPMTHGREQEQLGKITTSRLRQLRREPECDYATAALTQPTYTILWVRKLRSQTARVMCFFKGYLTYAPHSNPLAVVILLHRVVPPVCLLSRPPAVSLPNPPI